MKEETIDQKIEQLEQVTKEKGQSEYAQAQLELGRIYRVNKVNYKQAITHFSNVEKEDNEEAYAKAQCNIAAIYADDKNIEQAKFLFSKVKKKYSPKAYAFAQLYLGYIYGDEKNIEKAISHYKLVKRKDDSECYVYAQYNLAVICEHEGNNKENIEDAKSHYENVKREDNQKLYACAQFNLAVIYEKEINIKDAKLHYENVKWEDNQELYARAQYNLAVIYEHEENFEDAKSHYLQVKYEDDRKLYAYTQLYLGNHYFHKEPTPDLKQAAEFYKNVFYPNIRFDFYVMAQVRLMVINYRLKSVLEDDYSIISPIRKIRESTEEIQKQLLVTFKLNESINNQELQFERKVAHYTRAGVLFYLLKNEPSEFRLNVIDFMNDPTENQVLTSWLGIKTDPNNDIKSFLASFSFNHNSLNQFRLYGNENNIVGSSVSMVFNQQFFCGNVERSINGDAIDRSSQTPEFQKANNDLILKKDSADSNDSINQNNTTSIYPLPLFRCLYFDPNSEYISIAKRSKFSFYLEHQDCSSEDIETKWNAYIELLEEQNKIDTIRKLLNEIKEEFIKLKVAIEKLKASKKLKVFHHIEQLTNLAIMPISCLIKHAAFEDEDECRVIYITNIADEKIQAPTDYALANSLFVNYNKVEDFLEKIYLGPQCPPYHKLWITNHFRTSKSKTRSKAIKVVQSEMPLR